MAARLKSCPDTKRLRFPLPLPNMPTKSPSTIGKAGKAAPRNQPTLGNLEPPIRSKGLNGKEETTHNDDPSAELYGGDGNFVRWYAPGANGQSEFRAKRLLRQCNHDTADRRRQAADARRGH